MFEQFLRELTSDTGHGTIRGRQATRERGPDFILTSQMAFVAGQPSQRAFMAGEGPNVYAVIETGGKQYRVAEGDTIDVERLPVEKGATIEIDRVLMVAGDTGIAIGAPVVDGATVVATVSEHLRGPKIVVFKFKAKKRYRRKMGHRQELTRLTIDTIKTA